MCHVFSDIDLVGGLHGSFPVLILHMAGRHIGIDLLNYFIYLHHKVSHVRSINEGRLDDGTSVFSLTSLEEPASLDGDEPIPRLCKAFLEAQPNVCILH